MPALFPFFHYRFLSAACILAEILTNSFKFGLLDIDSLLWTKHSSVSLQEASPDEENEPNEGECKWPDLEMSRSRA